MAEVKRSHKRNGHLDRNFPTVDHPDSHLRVRYWETNRGDRKVRTMRRRGRNVASRQRRVVLRYNKRTTCMKRERPVQMIEEWMDNSRNKTETADVRYHFFFVAFSAALVILPPFSVFSTDLMTPTATVCRISRTAKRPRGGYSL